MKKLIIYLLLLAYAYSCALCALYTPTAHVSFNGEQMSWKFSPNFTEVLIQGYDIDGDGAFDAAELAEIKAALIDYLAPRNYLLKMAYYDLPLGAAVPIVPQFERPELSVQGGQLVLEFTLKSDFAPQPGRVLRMQFFDEEGYFRFALKGENLSAYAQFSQRSNVNLEAVFYEFIEQIAPTAKGSKLAAAGEKTASETAVPNPAPETAVQNPAPKQNPLFSQKQPTPSENPLFSQTAADRSALPADRSTPTAAAPAATDAPGFFARAAGWVFALQGALIAALKAHSAALYALAFAYGAAHALLPSHGKSFGAAYFASRRLGAALFALKVGFAHLLSSAAAAAFFGSLAAFKVGFASGYFVAAMAFGMIIFRLLRRPKFLIFSPAKRAQMPTARRFGAASSPSLVANFARKAPRAGWLARLKISRRSADWLAAAAIGLVPCPGMVLVLGLLAPFGAAALGAAVCIALGMSFSVYFCAFLAGRFRLSERAQLFLLAAAGLLALVFAINGV